MELSYLEWYILFALTTAIAAHLELFAPAVKELGELVPNHNMVEYKKITYFVFFCTAIIFAPLVLLSCIVPSMGERFRKALVNQLSKNET